MTNLAQLLEKTAATHPERTAIVSGATRLTFEQVNDEANRVANLLRSHGVHPGDKVALSCPNVAHFTTIYYGILKAGAVVVPLNILLKWKEVAYHLADSEAKAYFAFEGTPDLPIGEAAREGFEATPSCEHLFLLRADVAVVTGPSERFNDYTKLIADQPGDFATVDVHDDDTAVILYTSGTTGQPKGAELRHRNMRDNALSGTTVFGSTAEHPDVYLCTLPLFHTFGQTCIQNGAMAFGGTLVMLPRFDARAALNLMVEERVTFFAGVPTMYWGLLGALDETVDVATISRNLRVAAAGGSALPVDIHRQFQTRFDVTIIEGYGLSETSPVASFSPFGQPPRVGSIGIPIPGVEMKLINDDWSDVSDDLDEQGLTAVGEIAIKGHNVMKGYYNRPDATAAAIRGGWFRSGDLARRDADGYYYIVDRSKDMIIRGGYNVYPREIEEVLITHPAVSLVAVIGVPHESHGEEIKAVVVLSPGKSATSQELVSWSKAQLAAYKYPRIVEIVDSLPMTATGKVLKRELN